MDERDEEDDDDNDDDDGYDNEGEEMEVVKKVKYYENDDEHYDNCHYVYVANDKGDLNGDYDDKNKHH